MTVKNKLGTLDVNGVTFFGRTIERFQDEALRQTEQVFKDAGLIVPVRSCSLLLAIGTLDQASASDVSQYLGYSHQLVLQKIPKLTKLGLIETLQDPQDARRRIFRLTQTGNAQAEQLEHILPAFADAYLDLFAEVGDIEQLMRKAYMAIQARPLNARIKLPRE